MAPAGRDDRPEPARERLPKSGLLRRSNDIRVMLRKGKRRKTPCLDVFVLASPSSREASTDEGSGSRFGVVVPKHGRTIVERNRVKRRIREIGRRKVMGRLRELDAQVDVLVRARREAYQATYRQLEKELLGVVEAECSLS